jgi:hypothetical protein
MCRGMVIFLYIVHLCLGSLKKINIKSAQSINLFQTVDLISAKLSQAAPEASDKWKEQPANAIERWKAKNLATANKEAASTAEKTSWGRQENRSGGRVVDTELRRQSRSRSRERMRNKDLAMAGVGSGGVSSAFGRSSSAAGGVLPTPVFGQRTASKFDAPASFNPFDRSEAGGGGGGGFGGRSQLGGSGLLPFPEDGDSISGSRFSAGSDGGISFRAPNPFDNRGFSGSSSSALDNLSQRPFDAFSSPSGGGGSGGFGAAGVTFGGGMNPFDNRGGDSGGGGNPFDRRRSRFDEPPAQIQRPGVWNENDQVRAMCIWCRLLGDHL